MATTWWGLVPLLLGWGLAWAFLWNAILLDALYVGSNDAVTSFIEPPSDAWGAWIAAGAGVAIGIVGVFCLSMANRFTYESPACVRVWQIMGILIMATGLLVPILFPSATSIVVDRDRGLVEVQQRWLYASEAESIAFEEVERLELSLIRREVGDVTQPGCLINTTLSLVRPNRTYLELPDGFPHEEMAGSMSDAIGAPMESYVVNEC
ncbi:MAG: hypothetical protein OXL97_06010 [Chloroflexota bacterium]|nr:hypothetical protein [Chloroflexota bacterium]MDE2885303.1 hypothetical protein [Chloroflexota bacterium]